MPQQKINLFSTLRPVGADTSQSDVLRSLAGLAGQASDLAISIGVKQKAKQGAIEGAQAAKRDEEGKLLSPELKNDITPFGQSYNRSAVLAYQAQIQIDSKENLDRLENENKLDPAAFKASAEAYKQGAISGMPQEIANSAGLDIDQSVANRYDSLMDSFNARKVESERAIVGASMESASDEILTLTRRGKHDQANAKILQNAAILNAAVEEGLIGAVQAESIRENIRERMQEQKALGEIDRVIFDEKLPLGDRVNKGVAFLENLKSNDIKDLSPEQKDSLVNVISSKVGALQAQYTKELSQTSIEQERDISNLKISAKNNLVPAEKIVEKVEEMFNSKLLSEAERTSIINDVISGQQKSTKKAIDLEMVAKKLSGTHPEIVLDQKLVDSYYREVILPGLSDADSSEISAANADFISLTKMIPHELKAGISNALASNNFELISGAVDTLSRIDEIQGIAELVTNTDQRAFADLAVALSSSMSGEDAVKEARRLTDPRDNATREAREKQIKDNEYEKDGKYNDWAEDEFPLIDGVNKDNVSSEYKLYFEAYFKSNPNEDRAKEYATKIIKSNWSESEFGFMKHPPEKAYDMPGHAIREQLSRDLKDRLSFEGKLAIDFDDSDLFLVSDKRTSREAAINAPSYRVIVMNKNGEFEDPGQRFTPDRSFYMKGMIEKNKPTATETYEGRGEGLRSVDDINETLKRII